MNWCRVIKLVVEEENSDLTGWCSVQTWISAGEWYGWGWYPASYANFHQEHKKKGAEYTTEMGSVYSLQKMEKGRCIRLTERIIFTTAAIGTSDRRNSLWCCSLSVIWAMTMGDTHFQCSYSYFMVFRFHFNWKMEIWGRIGNAKTMLGILSFHHAKYLKLSQMNKLMQF